MDESKLKEAFCKFRDALVTNNTQDHGIRGNQNNQGLNAVEYGLSPHAPVKKSRESTTSLKVGRQGYIDISKENDQK